MQFETILFDLDGTLTDPGLGITNSVMFALERFGIHESDRQKLYPFIGPPLWDSFMRFYGMSREEADRAVTVYREYYADRGLFENTVYPGIPQMLEDLRVQGKTLAVATSKPEGFSVKILEHFGLAKFFDRIAGASMDQSRSRKADVIRYALSELPQADPRTTVMVGDREHDVLGAREVGLPCVGVLYGYGNRPELEAAGALSIAENVEALKNFLSR